MEWRAVARDPGRGAAALIGFACKFIELPTVGLTGQRQPSVNGISRRYAYGRPAADSLWARVPKNTTLQKGALTIIML